MRAIVTGMIASYPLGGVVWDYGQYALGLEDLGFEVYYLEDTGWNTYNPSCSAYGANCTYAVDFLSRSLRSLSPTLATRWRFRNLDGQTFGMDDSGWQDVLHTADLFLNVSGGTLLRDDYMVCRRKVLIDSDPGWNHFRNYPKWDAQPKWYGSHGYRAHDFFFTYAERIGRSNCKLPTLNLPWQPTRPPVVPQCWQAQAPGETWTTVMTWKNFQETIQYQGLTYGTKEMEFTKVENLPACTNARFEVAVGGSDVPSAHWQRLGWAVRPSERISETVEDYRRYIQGSRGEFSVAKNVYVATHCGWFSCRSVCYLAAGLPVVLQDTGFSDAIPTGEGLWAFSDLKGALQGIERIEEDYEHHRKAARQLAREYFDHRVVLSDLLKRIGL